MTAATVGPGPGRPLIAALAGTQLRPGVCGRVRAANLVNQGIGVVRRTHDLRRIAPAFESASLISRGVDSHFCRCTRPCTSTVRRRAEIKITFARVSDPILENKIGRHDGLHCSSLRMRDLDDPPEQHLQVCPIFQMRSIGHFSVRLADWPPLVQIQRATGRRSGRRSWQLDDPLCITCPRMLPRPASGGE